MAAYTPALGRRIAQMGYFQPVSTLRPQSLRSSAWQIVRISRIGTCLLSYVVLFVLGSLGFFEEFGGVWAAEQVDSPVGEYVCSVEVVAQLVQVNPLPDERPEQTTQLYSKDVD